MTYKTILVYDDHQRFDDEVNAAIADGWQLHGGVSVASFYQTPDNEGNYGGSVEIFMQAMVKETPSA